MRSNIVDLLKLYKAFLVNVEDQFAASTTSTERSSFKQVAEMMSAKIPLDQPSRNEASYDLGWGRIRIPGRMGQIGINPSLVPDGMPIVDKGVSSQSVLFHQGSASGALSIVLLLPDSDTVIVATSNVLALNDVPDWVARLVLEEFLEVPTSERNDYIELAKISVAENIKWYPNLIKELEQSQKKVTSLRSLEDYVGTYWDHIHVFKIVVMLEGGQLYWALQGLKTEKFLLEHYEDDTFTWLRPRNDFVETWSVGGSGPGFGFLESTVSRGRGSDQQTVLVS